MIVVAVVRLVGAMVSGFQSLVQRGVRIGASVAFLAFGVAGCARPPISIEPELASWINQDGTGVVRGRTQIALRSGGDGYCNPHDNPRHLVPQTPLSSEIARQYAREPPRAYLEKYQPIGSYLRTTRCDKDGSFSFENLPTGEYYFMGYVQWIEFHGLVLIHQSRRLVLPVVVEPGKTTDLGTMIIR